ncbi:MAG TPA: DUF3570 domain-containing protein, partial [Myxococcaceae bacterium]|nr:DUF3570 domain-containing protein [Myxococcaceae bacterium]
GGLSVWTTGAQTEQQISPSVSVKVSALADQIILKPPPPTQVVPPGPGQPTGHLHPGVDIITSASVLAPDSSVRTEKWRFEGIAGAKLEGSFQQKPARLEMLVRGSTEPDFKSLGAWLFGEAELFERNTTIAGFVGGGGDTIQPRLPPPGQESIWPASQGRLNAGASITQLLSKVLVGSAGFGFTHQWGTLWSPYRRALVNATLFPEVLPGNRERFTSFVALSSYLGGGTALHLRQGFYLDSWQVMALIPEAAIAKEIGDAGLVSFRYRYYGQQAASFYRPVYSEKLSILSGDPRNGDLSEHVGSVDLRWSLSGRPGWSRALTLLGSYELSLLSYRQLRSSTRAQVFSLGLVWGY